MSVLHLHFLIFHDFAYSFFRYFDKFFSGKPLEMDTENSEERVGADDNPPIPENNRKQLAVHLILASIFFESIAFYALTGNIGSVVKILNWNRTHGSEASYIFTGK